jgi:hypothetical protein
MAAHVVHPGAMRAAITRSRLTMLVATALCMLASPLRAVQVDLTMAVNGELQPVIQGSCNLPDGVKLLVRVTRKESAYQSETPVEVQGGHFELGPLLQGTNDLNPGVYNIEIMSLPEQPDAIRAVLGQRGEELRGPLTKRDPAGTRVRFVSTFTLGRAANLELDRARREQVKLSETRWWRKNCTDICSGAEHYAERKGEPFDRPACFKTCVSYPPSIAR